MKINKKELKKIIIENLSNKFEEIKQDILMRMDRNGNIGFDNLIDIANEHGVDVDSDIFLGARQEVIDEISEQRNKDLKFDIDYVISEYFDDEYAPFSDFYEVFKNQNFEHEYSKEEVRYMYDKITVNPNQLKLDLQESNVRKVVREVLINEAKKSKFQKLKDNKVPLTDEERKKVMDAEAVWHHGPNGEATPAVWKSKDKKTGKVTYITNTHRAYNTAPTLKGAIGRYHKFIKGTA